MDGGYINEAETVLSDDEGGQLKTKNGQKYIINHRIDGFYITKRHAVLIASLIFIVMLAYAVAVYFLMANSGSSAVGAPEKLVTSPEITQTAPAPASAQRPRAIKLNEGWSPTLYRLLMHPNIEKGDNVGRVIIDIVKDANARDWPPIVLDINNITITKAEVFESNATLTKPLKIKEKYGENNETFIIELAEKPNNLSLQVKLKFVSHLSNTLQGFYKVGYNDIGSDEKKWLASTQFSPIDARRAFPCFDRPDKKAEFEISMIHDRKLSMVLSNMPSKNVSSIPNSDDIREDFLTTKKMSTYLVAFMATNLINSNASRNVVDASLPQINIWTRKEVADMTQFAYDLTTKILPFYEEYFGIRYDLPKIDMVAVPEFGFSAMENWGLITFKESALLVPEDEEHRSSAGHTEHVASILAHELAHQWFGNLVTMKWWDDLWLKEGFATYMSYVAINKLEPSWKHLDFFTIRELQKAMDVDSDLTAHPISFNVDNSADIRRIFDPISYSKGASIIRMMQSFLGESAFKDALKSYLKKFQYKNAVHDDLWNVMTEFGHKYKTLPTDSTVKEIMDTWTIQAGYPVVSAKRNGTSIQISQKRYLLPNGEEQNDKQTWHIPITIVTMHINKSEQRAVQHYWLKDGETLTLENVIDSDHLFYINDERTGYYRITYDYNTIAALGRKYESLPAVTFAQLIDDSWAMARAEIVAYDIPLGFLIKLRSEDILPWAASTPGVQYVTNMLNREPAYEHLRALMRFILKPIYTGMSGFNEDPNESHTDLLHRALIVGQSCFYGHDYCINTAQRIYRNWMSDKALNVISPNMKSIVYCTALRDGSFQEWYFAYNRYMETTSASEKEIILDALGCTTKPWLLSKYLNMSITSTSGIRKQDGRRVFSAVAENSFGFEIAFEFLMTNIKEISEYFGDGFSTLSKMINSVTSYMNKDYHLEQLRQFKLKAEKLGLKSIEDSIHLAEQKVKNNIYWRSRSYYKLQEFLVRIVNELHINLY